MKTWPLNTMVKIVIFALTLLCAYSQSFADCDRGSFKILLDVGHAPDAGGALSASGVKEFVYNRYLALEIKSKLQALGFSKVELNLLAHENLASRPARANVQNVNILLSIHHDSVQPRYLSAGRDEKGQEQKYNDEFMGSSLFVSRLSSDYPASLAFAQKIGAQLRRRGRSFSTHHGEAIEGENRPLIDPQYGVYAHDNLIVLKRAKMPAVLLEAGVIVNREEEAWLASSRGRGEIAAATAAGIEKFCGAALE